MNFMNLSLDSNVQVLEKLRNLNSRMWAIPKQPNGVMSSIPKKVFAVKWKLFYKKTYTDDSVKKLDIYSKPSPDLK